MFLSWLSNIPWCICTAAFLSIHLWMEPRWLPCPSAPVNVGAYVSFSVICLVVGLLGHMVVLLLVFVSSRGFCSSMPSGDLYLSSFLVQKGPLAFNSPRLWKQSIINPNFFNSASVKARVKSICRSFR